MLVGAELVAIQQAELVDWAVAELVEDTRLVN
jgi:hypothetical protein